jgi:hypothetical protein
LDLCPLLLQLGQFDPGLGLIEALVLQIHSGPGNFPSLFCFQLTELRLIALLEEPQELRFELLGQVDEFFRAIDERIIAVLSWPQVRLIGRTGRQIGWSCENSAFRIGRCRVRC